MKHEGWEPEGRRQSKAWLRMRDIASGRAADPCIGNHLVSLEVSGKAPIALSGVLAHVPEEDVAAVIIPIPEGVRYQAEERLDNSECVRPAGGYARAALCDVVISGAPSC